MNVEKKRSFIIQFAYFSIIGLLVYFIAKYAFPLFSPFILGLIIAIIVRKLSRPLLLERDARPKLIYAMVLFLFYFCIAALALMGGTKAADLVGSFFNRLPLFYTNDIQPAIRNIVVYITELFPALEPTLQASYQSVNQTLLGYAERASNTVLNSLTGFAGTVTSLMIRTLLTIVSSVFLTMDLDRIEAFLKRQMSDKTVYIYENVLYNIGTTAFRFIRAYLIIIGVTFTELALGFSLLGLANPLILAFLIAIMDALPVIGTGTVMVPWMAYNALLGNYQLALSLFVIYVIIFVVRQSIEPKVVGDQIGLSPIIILMCLYVGVRLFGIVGMFILPLAITIFKKLNDDKVISVLR